MTTKEAQREWTTLSLEEKEARLYLKQKQTLEMFRERKAITEEEYIKGLEALNKHEKEQARPARNSTQ